MMPNFSKWTDIAAARGLRVIVIVLVSLILIRMLRSLTRRLIPKPGSEGMGKLARMHEQHVKTLASLMYSAGTAVIVVGAVLMALPDFGYNVTPIAAAAGLASLSIGFGAQHLVRDVINGFFIIIEDQFVVGESVRIASPIGTVTGRVEHLTLRRTVVRDAQGAVVTIPNGEVSQVANLSRDWGQMFVDISIPQETPADAALAALERACSELRNDAAWSPVLVDGPRALGLDNFGPAGSTLRLVLRTVPGRQDDAARELRRRIQNRFDQEHLRWGGVQRVEIAGNAVPESFAARSNS